MPIRKITGIVGFYLLSLSLSAQGAWWVFFHDKGDTSQINLHSFFTKASLQRRAKQQISFDIFDYPVSQAYLQQVIPYVDSIGYTSRWLNAVKVYASHEQIQAVSSLPFVDYVEYIDETCVARLSTYNSTQRKNPLVKALSEFQLERLGLTGLKQMGLTGNGIRICIIDAGFIGAPKSSGFIHIFSSNRIEKTWDFIKKDENVYRGSTHGTMVLSCLAGMNDSLQTGLATGATFLLARTESEFSENKKEEDRWIAALEWADQQGAQIVNSSLGYAQPRYNKSELNGQSHMSQAASKAADKGMLLVNAAGNEYNSTWKTLIIPADADHILTVGAVNPETDYQTSYSSVGPTADGRLKPNVSAPGWVAVFDDASIHTVEGTSFASPLVAGLAACIWEAWGDTTRPLTLLEHIEQAGHLYPYFDYAHGYGIPHAERFFSYRRPFACFKTELVSDYLIITPDSLFMQSISTPPLFYFHVQNKGGVLRTYGLIVPDSASPIIFTLKHDAHKQKKPDKYELFIQPGDIIRLHMNGYTEEIAVP